ncbi:MAG: CHAT domain protein [Syntrophorhabdus sp. PtaU1.Bin153]|nr:MAG: CHAT domain protein [Syntrophorhabdus sp. PtaU1.Bin153]
MTAYPNNCKADTIDQLKAAREDYIEHFRIHGERDEGKAKDIEGRLKSLKKTSQGKLLAQTLFELATIQRITNQFEIAIENYGRAALVARENLDTGIEFDAWLGIARSHAYGTRNHGAAAAAFERAIASAGATPTQKQRYDMADYSSQLQAGRGELESALLNALEAVKLAQDDQQRFYAFLDTGDVLQKFAESCDYRKLVDAKSNSENDLWGACKRAVGASRSYYDRAGTTANKLGWTFLEKESQGFSNRLDTRLFLINQKANFEQFGQADAFNAGHVLVNENFSAGGSELTSGLPLGALIEQILPESQANDPRSIYLRGIKADLEGNPTRALEYFKKATGLLGTERSSLFDLRQRGTVVENRPELVRDLGLRLLAFRKYDEAFVVFESLRSRGLEWLATAFDKSNFTDAERRWIADLVQMDSLISAKQNGLVETAIAGVEHSRSLELLDELNRLTRRRLESQEKKQFQSVVKRLKSVECEIPTLAQLKAVVDKADIPVLLYWVTPTNVLVWAVSPKGVEVKTVFLPEAAVVDKVSKLRDSVGTMGQAFDDKSAKELYAYLLKPFTAHLDRGQVIVIPQGPLVGLPFEATVDAGDGKFLAQKLSVSYAPNAAFAIRALKGKLPDTPKITAIYDDKIENETHEISQIKDLKNALVSSHATKGMNADAMVKLLGGAQIVHVLLHGEYNYDDPLQSTLKIGEAGNQGDGFITAAELLATDWRYTQLAVFSSCEGAAVKTRISNEQFGISWALLAGGTDHVVLSRWRVNAASNAAWMEAFYRNLLMEKMSPALAANAAMRRMIGSDKPHPYYWAGPQVFGR